MLYSSGLGPFITSIFFHQRYGPPPSYPHLKIPGLNAPIPRGASFGYHPGGWGKPPVDEVHFLYSLFFSSFDFWIIMGFWIFIFIKGLSHPFSPHWPLFLSAPKQYGRPLYGDVFGVHQQDQPNYEVDLHRSFM